MSFWLILFQKSGKSVQGFLLFVPLRRFYAVLFVPLFCRPREKCGTMWKTTWRHNVDNIRQKDIKNKSIFVPILAGTWRRDRTSRRASCGPASQSSGRSARSHPGPPPPASHPPANSPHSPVSPLCSASSPTSRAANQRSARFPPSNKIANQLSEQCLRSSRIAEERLEQNGRNYLLSRQFFLQLTEHLRGRPDSQLIFQDMSDK